MSTDVAFEGWAILELMGHRRLAGYVREVEIAGQGMLRLDVPIHETAVCTCGSESPQSLDAPHHNHDCMLFAAEDAEPADVAATQFYSPSALYCLTPTTEAIARKLASAPRPAQRWELEPAKPTEVFQADPWDVDEIEEEARDEHTEAEWADLQGAE